MSVRARSIVSTLAVTVTTLACTGSDQSGGELAGPTWTVTSLPGATIPAGLRIDATFREDGTVGGSDGCNRYGGPYSVTGDGGIDIGGLGGTDIGCGSRRHRCRSCLRDGARQGRRPTLDALGSVERWKFSGPAFQLLNETATVEATYVPG